jgi:hypothetical protein
MPADHKLAWRPGWSADMTLLDRFRPQSPDKHPDPAVRLAYVEEVPLGERDAILSIAREDEDPRVRRAAVAKLMDPASLAQVMREDVDQTVRAQAVVMLRDIGLEAFEGVSEGDSLDAVDALDDAKVLAQIAKTAIREVVALKALSRLSDVHSLGSVARHAVTEAARRGAFELLHERGEGAEVLAVAMNSEYKDAALAAVEAVTDRAELEQFASRGKNKAAAKRARAVLREAEEQAAHDAAKAAASVPTIEPAAPDAGPTPVASLSPERATLSRIDGIDDIDTERAARAREQAEIHARAREEHARRHARLAELGEEAWTAAADADLESAKKRFGAVRREWKDLAALLDVDPALAARFAEADAQLTARETEAREADTRARREALARLQHLVARVEPLAAKSDVTLKAIDRALRDVRAALASVPPLPSKQDVDEVGRRLKAAHAALTHKVHELREAAEWQQWANAGIQEQLCVKMEGLRALEDPDAILSEVRELQQQWRQAADVPRAQADAMWRRFTAAHDEVWGKCEAHFAAQAAERAENLAKKAALCEKAEALAGSTSWIQTAEEIKRLQAEWKTIGPVSRGREKAIWERFRAACDRFFTRRHEDLVHRKAAWAENLAKKEALSVRAEALADSTDWETAAAEIKRLQNEWKTIGPVKKTRSDAIWQRFRGACDRFFARYAQRHDVARAERAAARETICTELEALSADAAPAQESRESVGLTPQEILASVRALRARWQQEVALRGVEQDRARALEERFTAAFARVLARRPDVFGGTDLDPDANRRRMESLVRRVEELAASLEGPLASAGDAALSPTTRLAAMLKEALAANTIGGKVDDDSRWRAAAEEVRQAQASWSRIGVVPDRVRHSLADRFERACRRILERAGRPGGPDRTAGSARRPY